mgnify:CR=1 FL=1
MFLDAEENKIPNPHIKMKKSQIKQVNKEIKGLRNRILVIVNDRILDQLNDDIHDEVSGLMEKITIEFIDDSKLTELIYGKLYDAIVKKIKRLLK